ncbi:proprotein convertase subtilisin/kexin type 6-like [Phyllostomus hastatus]|uniref:proprotein convertase subtilisin/kexin type 6-like n=1 Tax=Phyllostomus hastatus TaxID=9423 RepID=UPI001E680F1B|nr:proprotein convertase subtilisin/kexin type 6-like [Phyllostomus hastatus]
MRTSEARRRNRKWRGWKEAGGPGGRTGGGAHPSSFRRKGDPGLSEFFSPPVPAATTGPSGGECIHCTAHFHFQDWKCVPACGEGCCPQEMRGLLHKVCQRCNQSCLSCEGSSRNCSQCKTGSTRLGTSSVANHTCSNADETCCEMVKSNRLCERKLFVQFCCRTCLLAE